MSTLTAVVLECPQCAAPVEHGSNICKKCYSEIIVKSVSTLNKLQSDSEAQIKKYIKSYNSAVKNGGESAEIFTALGICQLKRSLYDEATKAFEKAIDLLPDDGDTYFYAAVSLLCGKKAFLAQRSVINIVEKYLTAAVDIEEKPIYLAFQAYIKFDYYTRKSLITQPSYGQALSNAKNNGLTKAVSDELYEILRVSCPSELAV